MTPRAPGSKASASRADATLKIPRPLYERISDVIAGTGFRSVTEFCVYVLRDVVSDHGPGSADELTVEEIEAIRRRLRTLGYLD